MRAVVITKHGPPDVLQVQERPAPDRPLGGQVAIDVAATGINFADTMARVGLYPDAPPLPCVLGYEVSGEIDRPIDRAGEKVLATTRFGGQSELVCVPASAVLPIPDALSYAEGASIPVVWLTAWHMLVELGNLRRGQTVLIHAAAGGVGTAALQICKKLGATAIGTASAPKHERLRELDHSVEWLCLRSYGTRAGWNTIAFRNWGVHPWTSITCAF